MDIHVSNLPFKLTEEELKALFEKHGEVEVVNIIKNHKTRQNKGFGFVKMPNKAEAGTAIYKLNGFTVMDRKLKVSESATKEVPEKKAYNWKANIKKKTSVVSFDGQPKRPVKGKHKKRRGHGRGTTY
ncbi:RNA recognition motif domain-containing protein [Arcticibacterium luteifluviistationis]|uniref:RNA-binding protein n=1 Tax=Arcticibacterium luteifluviistationis TaxID=1784714 RepID=A0A2Z4GHB9_9BACT|nr:RNA-binding protein [Arcticibacterium luteifluviistationis]AWW00204.1 RNA-binding protein [Arcticibacterium luteifluviistationis]